MLGHTRRTRRRGGIRRVALGLAAVVLTASAGCSQAAAPRGHRPGAATLVSMRRDSWSSLAESDDLVTDPTSLLSAGQVAFLREVATRTWTFLSGPAVDPATDLPCDSVLLAGDPGGDVQLQPLAPAQQYTNPALIGNYLSSVVAARDVGAATPAAAEARAAAVLHRIQKMATYKGFLFRWYSTATGLPITGPRGEHDPDGYVSTVDNGWLAEGLLVAREAFPDLAPAFGALLDAMQWQFLYNSAGNVLYNGYQVGKGYSESSYENAYSGPRIAEYMAIGSGKVAGALWWGPNRTPPAGHRQRQVPRGHSVTYTDPQNHAAYPVFEGHYVYDGITFVPTFTGSMYQALAPDLVVPEQTMAPKSLGLNDRNTALAQGAYGTLRAHTPVWGWAPAASPGDHVRYTDYGAADLAVNQGAISHAAVVPYASFLALPVIPDQAYANIAQLTASYPRSYTTYGFLDSVDLSSGAIAGRFMAASQMAVLMAVDDAVDHDRLQTYTGDSTYGQVLAPYLRMERYSIQDAGGSGTPTP